MAKKTYLSKAVLVSSLGGGLEMYDFTIYIFFTPILATLFFPKQNHSISLLITFAVFAVGYFSRPLGSMIFGHYGDQFGRKKGMLISIAIMAISTTFMGLLPTYATLGIAAPVLLIILRFLQGLAVGGDLPGALTFVAEHADQHQRGLACSLVFCAINIGILLASAVSALLAGLLSYEHLQAWGWRIAFFLGLAIAMIGFYLRYQITETPYFTEIARMQKINKNPLRHLFKIHTQEILKGIGLVWLFSAIIAQIFLYMPTYLTLISHLKLNKALIINSANTLLFSLLIPIIGYLSDKIGRRFIILASALLMIFLSYPLYSLLNYDHLAVKIIALICFSILSAGIVGAVPSLLSEMFLTHVRYSGVAISYNISFAIIAGLTPTIVTYLLYNFHRPEVPCLNLILAAVITFIAAFTVKDLHQQPLKTMTHI